MEKVPRSVSAPARSLWSLTADDASEFADAMVDAQKQVGALSFRSDDALRALCEVCETDRKLLLCAHDDLPVTEAALRNRLRLRAAFLTELAARARTQMICNSPTRPKRSRLARRAHAATTKALDSAPPGTPDSTTTTTSEDI